MSGTISGAACTAALGGRVVLVVGVVVPDVVGAGGLLDVEGATLAPCEPPPPPEQPADPPIARAPARMQATGESLIDIRMVPLGRLRPRRRVISAQSDPCAVRESHGRQRFGGLLLKGARGATLVRPLAV